jgi:molybdopterin converting factor small subunit
MKKIILVAGILVLVWGIERWNRTDSGVSSQEQHSLVGFDSEPRSGSQFESEGTVVRMLADDNVGSRHQRFIIRLASGRTVLVAHNIDLAPRIEDLSEGDTVSFSGEFEDNDKGGVLHWTHHDPAGKHIGGWIRHAGRIYQ